MIVVESDRAAFFDVDETLILMDDIDFQHPLLTTIEDEKHGIFARVIPHEAHIQKMKEHHSRGHKVFVWSAGGWAWAQAVVIDLGLEQYVTAIIPKGPWAWDDLPPAEWLKQSYIKPPTDTKNETSR